MMNIIPEGETLDRVFLGGVFTEGPAWDKKGNLLFSDCTENLIYSFNELSGKTVIWDRNSRHANGMNFDHDGRLVVCCDGKKYPSSDLGGAHAVRRYEKDGSVTTLAQNYGGKKLNGPNDLCFDSLGQIYFTDPRYGYKDDIEQDCMAVYRIDLEGKLTRVIEDLESPNGILISSDDRTLFLVDHNMEDGGARTLVRYDLGTNNDWTRTQTLLDFGTGYGMDGMVMDSDGNIYVTGGTGDLGGVYIVSQTGEFLGFIATPETPGNCTFGGEELDTLYIAATSSIFRMKLNAKGR